MTGHGRYHVPGRSRVFVVKHSLARRPHYSVRKQLSEDTERIHCRITLLRRILSFAEPVSIVLVRSHVHVLRFGCGNVGFGNHRNADSRTGCSLMAESPLTKQARKLPVSLSARDLVIY